MPADVFNQREKGFETKFRLDQEAEFKAEARRNKLLGLWLAKKFGMGEYESAAYAKAVVIADLEEPGVDDVVRKVMKDIGDRGTDIGEDDIRARLVEFLATARQQIAEEIPDAVDK